METIKDQKPKGIKTVGLVISIISGMMIFGNGMGALVWSFIGMGDNLTSAETNSSDPLTFIFVHYVGLCLVMVAIGIAYMVGGIFISKYRLWANQFVTGLTVLLILILWALMISMSISIGKQEGMEWFSYGALINALFWSIPLGMLIWYLNRKKVRKHFD